MTSDEVKVILDLTERCEKATGPDRELDATIAKAVGEKHGRETGWCNNENGDYYVIDECAARYTASIDAAMMLVPEGCEFWCGSKDATGTSWAWVGQFGGPEEIGTAASPALALCAAALRAPCIGRKGMTAIGKDAAPMTAPTLPICGWLRATNPRAPRDGEREKAIKAADTIEALYEAGEEALFLLTSARRKGRKGPTNAEAMLRLALSRARNGDHP